MKRNWFDENVTPICVGVLVINVDWDWGKFARCLAAVTVAGFVVWLIGHAFAKLQRYVETES